MVDNYVKDSFLENFKSNFRFKNLDISKHTTSKPSKPITFEKQILPYSQHMDTDTPIFTKSSILSLNHGDLDNNSTHLTQELKQSSDPIILQSHQLQNPVTRESITVDLDNYQDGEGGFDGHGGFRVEGLRGKDLHDGVYDGVG